MFNGLLTACDACAKPLDGVIGTAKIHKPHLIIKGNVGLVSFENLEENPHGRVFWAKKADDFSQLHVCDEKCLIGFLTGKQYIIQERRDARDKESKEWEKY